MLRNKVFHYLFSALDIIFRGNGINDGCIKDFARLVNDSNFTACTVRRVKSQCYLAFNRRLQKKRTKIYFKHFNSLFARPVGKYSADFTLNRGLNKPVVTVVCGFFDKFGAIRIAV